MSRSEFVSRMQEVMSQLWDEYQQQNVTADYSNPNYQEAYLLRYFFPYELILPKLLNHISASSQLELRPINSSIRAVALGSGPCPEARGLATFLSGKSVSMHMSAVDRINWSHARDLLPESDGEQFDFSIDWPPNVNIGESSAWSPGGAIHEMARSANLILLQNCLNELGSLKSSDILGSVKNMPPGGMILLSEREGYSSTLLQKLESDARSLEMLSLYNSYQIKLNSINTIMRDVSKKTLGMELFPLPPTSGPLPTGVPILAASLELRYLAIQLPK